MAYYGNLALRPERKPQETLQPARLKEKVVRRRQIPIGEKLLYLFTVVIFAVVAGLIIFRYAEIYQTNRQIQQMNRQYEQISGQTKELQREVERLSEPKRIKDIATNQLGMVPVDPSGEITVREGGKAAAMNVKK